MKIYVTKYCLNSGEIETYDGADLVGDNMAKVKMGSTTTLFYGKEWHLTYQQAVNRAEEMRCKKLLSLDKSAKKLSSLVFDVKIIDIDN